MTTISIYLHFSKNPIKEKKNHNPLNCSLSITLHLSFYLQPPICFPNCTSLIFLKKICIPVLVFLPNPCFLLVFCFPFRWGFQILIYLYYVVNQNNTLQNQLLYANAWKKNKDATCRWLYQEGERKLRMNADSRDQISNTELCCVSLMNWFRRQLQLIPPWIFQHVLYAYLHFYSFIYSSHYCSVSAPKQRKKISPSCMWLMYLLLFSPKMLFNSTGMIWWSLI